MTKNTFSNPEIQKAFENSQSDLNAFSDGAQKATEDIKELEAQFIKLGNKQPFAMFIKEDPYVHGVEWAKDEKSKKFKLIKSLWVQEWKEDLNIPIDPETGYPANIYPSEPLKIFIRHESKPLMETPFRDRVKFSNHLPHFIKGFAHFLKVSHQESFSDALVKHTSNLFLDSDRRHYAVISDAVPCEMFLLVEAHNAEEMSSILYGQGYDWTENKDRFCETNTRILMNEEVTGRAFRFMKTIEDEILQDKTFYDSEFPQWVKSFRVLDELIERFEKRKVD